MFRIRASAHVEPIGWGRQGIVITELPYNIGPEKVIAKIKELVQKQEGPGHRRSQGPDRPASNGLRIVIEVKNGFNPEAILAQLYKLTPLEESFGINNVALVDGQPGVTRASRSCSRSTWTTGSTWCAGAASSAARKRQDRMHLVDGLLVALLDIDAVIETIRTSEDAADARRPG